MILFLDITLLLILLFIFTITIKAITNIYIQYIFYYVIAKLILFHLIALNDLSIILYINHKKIFLKKKIILKYLYFTYLFKF